MKWLNLGNLNNMKNILNKDNLSEINWIKSLSSEIINSNITLLKDLGTLLVKTNDARLRDVLALKLSEIGNPKVVLYLLEALEKVKESNYNSTLIYACSEYDCSEGLNLFVDILIENDDVAYLDSIYAIKAIKSPVPKKEKKIALQKIKNYLSIVSDKEKKQNIIQCEKIINALPSI